MHCCGASLQDHEARDNFNRIQAALLNPPYTSTIRNPPLEASVKTKDLLTQESINAVSSKRVAAKTMFNHFRGQRLEPSVNECIIIQRLNTELS